MTVKLFKAHPALLAISALAATLALSACSIIEGEKIDYKSAGRGVSLEVPPDLTQLSRDSRYQMPGGTVTASAYQVGQAAPNMPTAASTLGDVRVERAGNERWLVVNRSPEQLWEPIREFWQESGFLINIDQPAIGIIETDWAENRAKIPQDFIRRTLGKIIDSVYSTSERDKFRTRLERPASGNGTEIYVSHRGMIEVYSNSQKDQTVWQPRPAEPELEAEFLRRLMVKLGTPADQAKTIVAAAQAKQTSRVTNVAGTPTLEVDEAFDRAWRRVGLALDRTGFTVEDRDRSNGTYFVRYVESTGERRSEGFLAKLFSKEDGPAPVKYRIAVKSQGVKTTVSVLNDKGAPESSAVAQKIVALLAEDLK